MNCREIDKKALSCPVEDSESLMLKLSKNLVSKLPAFFVTSIITLTSKQNKSKKKVLSEKKRLSPKKTKIYHKGSSHVIFIVLLSIFSIHYHASFIKLY